MSHSLKDQMLKSQVVEFSASKTVTVSPIVGLLTKLGRIEWRELLSTVFGACAMFFFILLFFAAWLTPASEMQGHKEKEVASYGDSLSARP